MRSFIGKVFHTIYRVVLYDLFLIPLRGGNGVTQMYELSQYTLNVVGVWMLIYEGINEGVQYSDNVLIAMIGILAAISGLKQWFNWKKNGDANVDK